MRKLLIILLILTVCPHIAAQTITGKIVDEKQQPIGYVNIVLQQPDSTFISGSVSDEKGNFILEAPQTGNYLLALTCIGYQEQTIRLEEVQKKRNLGNIILLETATELGEVSITASATIKKVDRQIIYPSQTQQKLSTSGYDLLTRLMLPELKIDPLNKNVSTISGGTVEIRINDLKASTAQVSALRPSDVLRVEYIDNPGAHYGDTEVEAVINYIVKHREAGISGGIEGMNAVTTGFGNDNIYVKANYGKSEFGIDYFINYRDYKHRYANETQRFTFPDGSTRNREHQGLEVPFGYVDQSIEASYNLTEPDKYVFNAVFTNNIFDTDKQDIAQRIIETGHPVLTTYTHATDHSHTPSLDLYLSYQLPHKQKLSANVVGTYINTDYTRDYQEYETEAFPLSHYAYGTDGNRYSLIGEAIYSKEWKKATLSAGVKGNTAYTPNIYTGDTDETMNMHNSSLYGYVQLQGRLAKLDYSLGAGVSRQAFSRAENSYSFVTFRPSLSLSYPLFRDAKLRYTFSIIPSTPSLSQLSDVWQQDNDLEASHGNKELKPYRSYRNRLVFSWNKGRFSTQLSGNYYYMDKPIFNAIDIMGNSPADYMVEYSIATGICHHMASGNLNLQWQIVPDALTLSGYGGVNWNKTQAVNYTGEYTGWNGGFSINGNYKNFSLNASFATRYKSLYGHYINYGENDGYIQLAYKYKKLTVGSLWYYPLKTAWTGGSRVVNSPYVEKKSRTYIKDNGNMVCLYLSWNFNYGRKHQAGKKTLNNSDTDSGIAK